MVKVHLYLSQGGGIYYCDGEKFIKLDNVDQDKSGEVKSAEVNNAGVVSFKNVDGTELFTLKLTDYIAGEIAKLSGSADIASVADGVVTIKSGVVESDGKISNKVADDIKLSKVATTGLAKDITINPGFEFGNDSEPINDVQDALETIVSVIDDHVNDKDVHITSEERLKWNGKQDAFENASVLSGISAEKVKSWDDSAAGEYDEKGAADAVKTELLGGADDTKDSATIAGAKKYADDAAKIVKDTLGTAAGKDFATDDIIIDSVDENLVNAKQVAAFVKDSVADLAGAMHFAGIVEGETLDSAVAAKDGYTPKSGDIVLWGVKEFVYDGAKWVEFGDEGAYEIKGTAKGLIDNLAGEKTGESNGVSVKVSSSKGEVSAVEVVAPDFAELYDKKGAADAVKTELLGKDDDTDVSNTIKGAKKYADKAVADATLVWLTEWPTV